MGNLLAKSVIALEVDIIESDCTIGICVDDDDDEEMVGTGREFDPICGTVVSELNEMGCVTALN